jgi:diguanylate cyclase (GGDEF)-like protein
MVCRLGGDEFVVLVSPGTTVEQCVHMAGRLLSALSAPIKTGAATIQVGASAGIAVSDPVWPATTSELLAQADAAVYRAKADGRGGVRVFDEQMRLDHNADRQRVAQLQGSGEVRSDGV